MSMHKDRAREICEAANSAVRDEVAKFRGWMPDGERWNALLFSHGNPLRDEPAKQERHALYAQIQSAHDRFVATAHASSAARTAADVVECATWLQRLIWRLCGTDWSTQYGIAWHRFGAAVNECNAAKHAYFGLCLEWRVCFGTLACSTEE